MHVALGLWSTTAWAVTDNQEAICSQPWVVFCDNFDHRALGQGDFGRVEPGYNGGWVPSYPPAPGGTISIVSGPDPTVGPRSG